MIHVKDALLVGAGGFVGSVLRLQVGAIVLHSAPNARFPWATLAVNLSGCFLVGIFASVLEHLQSHNAELRYLLITGFLGGFTTFSAFGLESVSLLRNGLHLWAAINMCGSVVAGALAVYIGLLCGPAIYRFLS